MRESFKYFIFCQTIGLFILVAATFLFLISIVALAAFATWDYSILISIPHKIFLGITWTQCRVGWMILSFACFMWWHATKDN